MLPAQLNIMQLLMSLKAFCSRCRHVDKSSVKKLIATHTKRITGLKVDIKIEGHQSIIVQTFLMTVKKNY
jgi:hypothetical protein